MTCGRLNIRKPGLESDCQQLSFLLQIFPDLLVVCLSWRDSSDPTRGSALEKSFNTSLFTHTPYGLLVQMHHINDVQIFSNALGKIFTPMLVVIP